MTILTKKIIFVGGKGGVGKTTTSTALALYAASLRKKTLLISTDPAHNIGHMFEKKIGGNITKVDSHLHALEIDPKRETANYIKQVKENVRGVVQPTMMEEVYRQLDTAQASPGADEAALFDKLISIVIEESEKYDHVIFDTAPTGHTIRLFTLPALLGVWIRGLLDKRHKTKETYTQLLHDGEPIDDPIYDALVVRKERFEKAQQIMLDNEQTSFIFVVNPERLPIVETEEAIQMLAQYDLHVESIIVNRVLPDDDRGQFFKQRKEQEETYLQLIDKTFTEQQIVRIPFFAHDIGTVEQLKQFSTYFTQVKKG